MTIYLLYVLVGALSGILAGLLGVGGGVIIVPALVYLFARQQFPVAHIQHMAVGTSLACILFTSLSSIRAHHGRKNVDWAIIRRMAPAVVAGAFVGCWLASQISTRALQWFFVVFLYALVVQMFMKTRGHAGQHPRAIPAAALVSAGSVIGGVSSLVGVGGGSMVIPFLTWHQVGMRIAIGTSAAVGFVIALSGAAGNILFGKSSGTLHGASLGFIYLPALAGVALTSVLTAPLGARLAHHLPVPILRRFFAVLLFVIATQMLIGLLA